MKRVAGMKYQFVGKVESINRGDNFYNTTILIEDSQHINIKLENNESNLAMGKLYVFDVIAEERNETEIVFVNESFRMAEEVLSDEDLEKYLKMFYTYAPLGLKQIKTEIESFLKSIKNEIIFKITETIYNENIKQFYLHPAATKFHHSYFGGLSYHTLSMLRLVDGFVKEYPYLNKDLLYSGIILHDMEKINEISGVDGEYTSEGLLVGHLVMGTVNIDRVATLLGYQDTEEVLMLKHIILSHHGQLIYGAAKKPQTGEALLLWYLDTIDSKFRVLGEQLELVKPGNFTQSVSVLDKGRFYKDKIDK